MAHLFDPLTLRGVTLRNRIVVSPMCEYSSHDGLANDWHLVHLGSRAVGGAGLVITEAAAVTAQGRITAADLGIYRDEHVAALARIVDFIVAQGAVAGIQLAHAGRKASTREPWAGGSHVAPSDGGWQTVAPSAIAPGDDATVPTALSLAEIEETIEAFVIAAKRAIAAGFRVIEIHAAHGYLVHEFFSPLTNTRVDQFGGSFDNRTRIAREIVRRVRAAIPDDVPLFTRISATDWVDGGWNLDESVALSRDLAALGCDLIDVSSGGLVRTQQIAIGPHYQVPFAQRIRAEANVATGAVGLITEPHAANEIVTTGQSDLVFLARELLRDPYWPLHAAHALGVAVAWPKQYERAKPPALVGAKGG
jgi:2,4-dienoyl-CoA reductase-like NADH-dependent reductase (Old Yellow Enzyme family)